jgi:hypothetical protein
LREAEREKWRGEGKDKNKRKRASEIWEGGWEGGKEKRKSKPGQTDRGNTQENKSGRGPGATQGRRTLVGMSKEAS